MDSVIEDTQTTFETPSHLKQTKPTARIFVLLIDSLPSRLVTGPEALKTFRNVRDRSTILPLETTYDAVTAPAIEAAFTGRPDRRLFSIVQNFSQLTGQTRSLFSELKMMDQTVEVYSDPVSFSALQGSIGSIKPNKIPRSDRPTDSWWLQQGLKAPFDHLKDEIARQSKQLDLAVQSFNKGPATLVIYHLTFFDQAAHSLNVHPELYRLATAALQNILQRVLDHPWGGPKAISAPTPFASPSTNTATDHLNNILVIFGDHGHDLQGRHLAGLSVPTAFLTIPRHPSLAKVGGTMPMHAVKVALQSLLGYANLPNSWPNDSAAKAIPYETFALLIFVATWQFVALLIGGFCLYGKPTLLSVTNNGTLDTQVSWTLLSWLPLLLLVVLPTNIGLPLVAMILGCGLTAYSYQANGGALGKSLFAVLLLTILVALISLSGSLISARELLAKSPPTFFLLTVLAGLVFRPVQRAWRCCLISGGSLLFWSVSSQDLANVNFQPVFVPLLDGSSWQEYLWTGSSFVAVIYLMLSPGSIQQANHCEDHSHPTRPQTMASSRLTLGRVAPYVLRMGMLGIGFLMLETTVVPLIGKLQIVTLVATARLALIDLYRHGWKYPRTASALQVGYLLVTFINLGWIISGWTLANIEWNFLYRLFNTSSVEHHILFMIPMILGRYILIIGTFSFFLPKLPCAWSQKNEADRHSVNFYLPVVLLSIASIMLIFSLAQLRLIESYPTHRENVHLLLIWLVLMVGFGGFSQQFHLTSNDKNHAATDTSLEVARP